MNFTLFDIIILAIVTISSIAGMYGGILKIIIGLIGFLAAIIVSYLLYPIGQQFLIDFFLLESDLVIAISASIICYIPALIMTNFFTAKISILVRAVSGGFINRLLGLFGGFIRGAIVGVILFLLVAVVSSGSYLKAATLNDIFIAKTADKYPLWLKNSLTVKYLDNAARNIILLIPAERWQSIKLPPSSQNKANNAVDYMTKIIRQKTYLIKADNQIINKDFDCQPDDLLTR